MKKLSESKAISIVSVILAIMQVTGAPALAADNIQMINNQPMAVVSFNEGQVATAGKSTNEVQANSQNGFDAGAITPAEQVIGQQLSAPKSLVSETVVVVPQAQVYRDSTFSGADLDKLIAEHAPSLKGKVNLQVPQNAGSVQYFIALSDDGQIAVGYKGVIAESKCDIYYGSAQHCYAYSVSDIGGVALYKAGVLKKQLVNAGDVHSIIFSNHNELIVTNKYSSTYYFDSLNADNRPTKVIRQLVTINHIEPIRPVTVAVTVYTDTTFNGTNLEELLEKNAPSLVGKVSLDVPKNAERIKYVIAISGNGQIAVGFTAEISTYSCGLYYGSVYECVPVGRTNIGQITLFSGGVMQRKVDDNFYNLYFSTTNELIVKKEHGSDYLFSSLNWRGVPTKFVKKTTYISHPKKK